MNVTPTEGQTVLPVWAISAELHHGGTSTDLPILNIHAKSMIDAINQIAERGEGLKQIGISVRIRSIEKGPITDPLAKANGRHVADWLLPIIMGVLGS